MYILGMAMTVVGDQNLFKIAANVLFVLRYRLQINFLLLLLRLP